MPILKDFRTTRTIELPSYPGSAVEIYDSLIVGDILGVDYKDQSDLQKVVQTLPKFIKSWNFTDEKEQPLPVTNENLNILKADDVQYLTDQIMSFNEDLKKKLNT